MSASPTALLLVVCSVLCVVDAATITKDCERSGEKRCSVNLPEGAVVTSIQVLKPKISKKNPDCELNSTYIVDAKLGSGSVRGECGGNFRIKYKIKGATTEECISSGDELVSCPVKLPPGAVVASIKMLKPKKKPQCDSKYSFDAKSSSVSVLGECGGTFRIKYKTKGATTEECISSGDELVSCPVKLPPGAVVASIKMLKPKKKPQCDSKYSFDAKSSSVSVLGECGGTFRIKYKTKGATTEECISSGDELVSCPVKLLPGAVVTSIKMLKPKKNPQCELDSTNLPDAEISSVSVSDECGGKFRIKYKIHDKVDGEWSDWTPGSCSVTCGGGVRTNTRTCTNPAPQYSGAGCDGDDKQTETCDAGYCPVDGKWSDWTPGSCSVTCGGGVKTNTRTCTNPAPQYGGAECYGDDKQTETCDAGYCPVDGKWSDWIPGSCSVTCGSGVKTNTRTCTNPAPQYGGAECDGDDKQTETCDAGHCPVDGKWSDWTPGSCSVTCRSGVRTNTRTCTNPAPQYGGAECGGDDKQTETCDAGYCPVDGDWSDWTPGNCSVTCGSGVRTNTRTCMNPAPQYGGAECDGDDKQTETCSAGYCPGC
ncbi:hypothetical protein ScPMuIL_002944 [Solemya velum]